MCYLCVLKTDTDMKHYPCVLTIAGSDPSGGAGIQADIKTISALGAYAASAITAITVQNTCGVSGVCPVPPLYIKGQIEAVMTDIYPSTVKIGMVGETGAIHSIAGCLNRFRPEHIVLDPVMVSTSGHKLMEDDAIEALTTQLMPLSTLVTPNLDEAGTLVGNPVSTVDQMEAAAQELLGYGCQAVLVKGGHLGREMICDVLRIKDDPHVYRFPLEKIRSRNTHGTGCTLSSAIATFLALGESLSEAVQKAEYYVHQGILAGKDIHIGKGHGPLNHLYAPIPMRILPVGDFD